MDIVFDTSIKYNIVPEEIFNLIFDFLKRNQNIKFKNEFHDDGLYYCTIPKETYNKLSSIVFQDIAIPGENSKATLEIPKEVYLQR